MTWGRRWVQVLDAETETMGECHPRFRVWGSDLIIPSFKMGCILSIARSLTTGNNIFCSILLLVILWRASWNRRQLCAHALTLRRGGGTPGGLKGAAVISNYFRPIRKKTKTNPVSTSSRLSPFACVCLAFWLVHYVRSYFSWLTSCDYLAFSFTTAIWRTLYHNHWSQ